MQKCIYLNHINIDNWLAFSVWSSVSEADECYQASKNKFAQPS